MFPQGDYFLNGGEDLKKAEWYLKVLIEEVGE